MRSEKDLLELKKQSKFKLENMKEYDPQYIAVKSIYETVCWCLENPEQEEK